ncbi:MAG: TolC family protein [Candidatus Aminicenantales bacterium]|jgi:outer membrane protein TolC
MTRKFFGAALLAAVLIQPVLGQEKEILNLTLEESIARALKNNLNVAVEMYTPQLAGFALGKAREIFLPGFQASYFNNRQNNPSYWWISGAGTNWSKMNTYSVSLAETIPTGGNLTLSLQNYTSNTNEPFQLINPRYGSTLRLDFVQPLLKNFGPTVTRRGILQAENDLDISNTQLRSTMIDTIYSVQEAYWNMVYSIENFKVKQQSLQLGRDLVAKNKKEVEFGQLAPLEILDAEATVAQREADLIQAEFLITRSEEVFKTMLNLEAEGDARTKKIVPVDQPALQAMPVSIDEAFKTALEKRPDLKIAQKTLETKELGVAVARNQALPQLDLTLSYWSPGISGDELIYSGNDILSGVIIGTVPGSPSSAFRDAFKMLYSNWNVGLTLTIPVSALTTRSDLAYAKTDLSQSQVRIKALEQQAALEISDAVRTIEADAKQAEAYRLARELAEKSLDAEVKKLAVGLSTNYFVLDYQEKLANARSAELKAKIDYVLAVARLERSMGVSLEKRGFKIIG